MTPKKKAPTSKSAHETQRISADELAALIKQTETSEIPAEEEDVFSEPEPPATAEPEKKKR